MSLYLGGAYEPEGKIGRTSTVERLLFVKNEVTVSVRKTAPGEGGASAKLDKSLLR